MFHLRKHVEADVVQAGVHHLVRRQAPVPRRWSHTDDTRVVGRSAKGGVTGGWKETLGRRNNVCFLGADRGVHHCYFNFRGNTMRGITLKLTGPRRCRGSRRVYFLKCLRMQQLHSLARAVDKVLATRPAAHGHEVKVAVSRHAHIEAHRPEHVLRVRRYVPGEVWSDEEGAGSGCHV